ncbi:hypothetical protein BWK47_13790 [Synechocystis sp. CACIAM 05]|nr:hypothetical protein BWK47_13790 [Synechocystis sp. CACIAM 05]
MPRADSTITINSQGELESPWLTWGRIPNSKKLPNKPVENLSLFYQCRWEGKIIGAIIRSPKAITAFFNLSNQQWKFLNN